MDCHWLRKKMNFAWTVQAGAHCPGRVACSRSASLMQFFRHRACAPEVQLMRTLFTHAFHMQRPGSSGGGGQGALLEQHPAGSRGCGGGQQRAQEFQWHPPQGGARRLRAPDGRAQGTGLPGRLPACLSTCSAPCGAPSRLHCCQAQVQRIHACSRTLTLTIAAGHVLHCPPPAVSCCAGAGCYGGLQSRGQERQLQLLNRRLHRLGPAQLPLQKGE